MAYKTLTLEIADDVALIRLDRPEALNAVFSTPFSPPKIRKKAWPPFWKNANRNFVTNEHQIAPVPG